MADKNSLLENCASRFLVLRLFQFACEKIAQDWGPTKRCQRSLTTKSRMVFRFLHHLNLPCCHHSTLTTRIQFGLENIKGIVFILLWCNGDHQSWQNSAVTSTSLHKKVTSLLSNCLRLWQSFMWTRSYSYLSVGHNFLGLNLLFLSKITRKTQGPLPCLSRIQVCVVSCFLSKNKKLHNTAMYAQGLGFRIWFLVSGRIGGFFFAIVCDPVVQEANSINNSLLLVKVRWKNPLSWDASVNQAKTWSRTNKNIRCPLAPWGSQVREVI